MSTGTKGWGIATDGSVLTTADGGMSWHETGVGAGNGVLFALNGDTAWYADGTSVGQVTVDRTHDAGASWQRTALATQDPTALPTPVGLTFTGPMTGWMMVAYGVSLGTESVEIYRTDDGGRQWALTATSGATSGLPTAGVKTGLTFVGSGVGFVTGSSDTAPWFVYVSRDGGGTWSPARLPKAIGQGVTYPARMAAAILPVVIDAHNGQSFGLLESGDLGRTWSLSSVLSVGDAPGPLHWTVFGPRSAVVSDGQALHLLIGSSWTARPIPSGAEAVASIDFISADTGWLVDDTGSLFTTTDGGATWRRVATVVVR
jgi:photosystem II stability/assembly factor-like uncharacterized protein